ncbi:MAG: hypothetical protein AAGF86_17245 [Pseudomonadota bacterium]
MRQHMLDHVGPLVQGIVSQFGANYHWQCESIVRACGRDAIAAAQTTQEKSFAVALCVTSYKRTRQLINALPLGAALTCRHSNVKWIIADFNEGADKSIESWLLAHMVPMLRAGHLKYFRLNHDSSFPSWRCPTAKNTAHILAATLDEDAFPVERAYVVNLDNDQVFSERWLAELLEKAPGQLAAMDIAAHATSEARHDRPATQPGSSAAGPSAGLRQATHSTQQSAASTGASAPAEVQLSSRTISERARKLNMHTLAGHVILCQWNNTKEMGLVGRISLPFELFVHMGGYNEAMLGMSCQDVDLINRAELLGRVLRLNSRDNGFSLPNLPGELQDQMQTKATRTAKREEDSSFKVAHCEGTHTYSHVMKYNHSISKNKSRMASGG